MPSTISRLSGQLQRRTWFLLVVVFLVLLGATFFVQIRIVVLRPGLGDISEIIGYLSQLLLIVATLFSGIMAYLSDSEDTGPATKIEVAGDYYDVTFGEQSDPSAMRDALSQLPEGGEPEDTGEGESDETEEVSEPEADDQP